MRLPWSWAEQRLIDARNYWIVTTRPSSRPHARPVWGVWLDNAFWFSTGSMAHANLCSNADITVHLESGSQVVIVEGTASLVTDRAAIERVVDAYNPKYSWEMDADALPGPFWRVEPALVFGWLSDDSGIDGGAVFLSTATRWRFGSG